MKLKVRPIGNSRGVILPQVVLEELGEDLELTLIGKTVVLAPAHEADPAEMRAALAYAEIKAKRHALFERLAKDRDEEAV